MGIPARYYSSTAVRTTLSASLSSSDTEIVLASSTNFPSQFPFTLILEKDSANEEIVTVTGTVGANFSMTRGVDGTSARAHSAGTSVEHGVSAKDFTDFRTHEAAANGVHDIGPGASVVGTTTTQTLTNKTLGGNLAAGGFKVTGLANPTSAQDAATKNFVETGVTSQVVLATTQATNAASSASSSASSASASSVSATASDVSRVAAQAAQAAAETAEANAETAQAAAEVAQVATATSESNASSSQVAAAASAATSSASQVASAASEANASTSATNAASSAVDSANSAAAAASALDSFDDRYLGSKSVAPTVDNDGDPLVQGALFYLNTGSVEVIGMYVFDGAGWLKASAASVSSIVTYEYTATASQTVFTGADDNALSMSFTSGLIQVFLNGVLLNPGDDYTTSVNTVTLASGAAVGDSLTVVAFASFNIANTYTIAEVDAAIAASTGSGGGTASIGLEAVFMMMGA